MKKTRRILSMILAAAMMCAGMTACGGTSSTGGSANAGSTAESKAESKDEGAAESKDEGGTADKALIKVGIINNDPNESGYRTANVNDLKNTFTEENGFDAQFSYSLKNDEQIQYAQKYIQDEVDYLLLSAADTAGWDTVLKDAKDAGVKVILFDRTIDADESLYEASIVSDMEKEGATAVEWLKSQNLDKYEVIHLQGVMGSAAQKGRSKALDDTAAELGWTIVSDMDKEGQTAVEWLKGQGLDKYEIIHLQGVMGSAAQKGRSKALDDTAKELGWTIVSQQTAEWNAEKAQQIVQTAIDSGKSFNVIYAENDDMAKGAVAALDKANISHGVGKDVIVMGFDCNKWALEELLNQNWNYDGQCNPFQSSYIKDIIDKLENGEKLSQKTIIMDEKGFDAATITQEDVDKYGI